MIRLMTISRMTNSLTHFTKKTNPLCHTLIGLLQIQFENYTMFLPFRFRETMDDFLKDNNILNGTFSWDEDIMKQIDQMLKEGAKFVHQDFINQLINNITQVDRFEVIKRFWIIQLWDKYHKDLSCLNIQLTYCKCCLNKVSSIIPYWFLTQLGTSCHVS